MKKDEVKKENEQRKGDPLPPFTGRPKLLQLLSLSLSLSRSSRGNGFHKTINSRQPPKQKYKYFRQKKPIIPCRVEKNEGFLE